MGCNNKCNYCNDGIITIGLFGLELYIHVGLIVKGVGMAAAARLTRFACVNIPHWRSW